jgi:hypothetical protein
MDTRNSIDQAALDTAMRRFPDLLAKCRATLDQGYQTFFFRVWPHRRAIRAAYHDVESVRP